MTPDDDSEIRSAELALIEAEVEYRLKAELDLVHVEAALQLARELARAEAIASERRARELARIERDSAVQRESAVAQARADAEAEARDVLASELARVKADGADHRVEHPTPDEGIRWDLVRWDLLAAGLLVVVALVAGVIWLPRALTSAARTSSVLVGSATRAAGRADRAARAAAEAVSPVVSGAVAKAREATRAGEPTSPPAAAPSPSTELSGPGFFAAFSRIPMDLYADGRRIGSTGDGQLLLPAGTHAIEFVSERFRYRSSITVAIRSGRVTAHTLALPMGHVRVTTTPGDEVWIEGQRVGIAPLEAIEVPIGTREVVVKDAAFGERREGVEVRFGETADITVTPSAATPATPPHLAPLSQSQPSR